MTCILKYLSILTFSCLCWGATEGSPFSKAVLHSPDPDLGLACKNIRFSSLFAAGDVSSPAAKSEEKRMFSQANLRCLIKFTILPKDLAFLLQKCQHCSPIAPFHFQCFDDNHIFPLAVFVLGLFPSTPFVSTHYSSSGSKDLKDFLFPPSTPLSEKYYYFWTPLAQTSMHPQIVLEIETIYNSIPIKAKFLQFSHLFARNCNTRSLLIKICLNSSVKFLHASV